jgi:hypothetical protein
MKSSSMITCNAFKPVCAGLKPDSCFTKLKNWPKRQNGLLANLNYIALRISRTRFYWMIYLR